ncbi:hypothetical protein GIB67_008095 [Kingdonia uniflora]|uniref:Uncharacterized protein n=1 Tax=Kingdonia uniflora TaxID=39325 RepID=A0A7J7MD40_9MAGN|nr:hypothetical protein GIB67_008095 [Kingdonia uniflora]
MLLQVWRQLESQIGDHISTERVPEFPTSSSGPLQLKILPELGLGQKPESTYPQFSREREAVRKREIRSVDSVQLGIPEVNHPQLHEQHEFNLNQVQHNPTQAQAESVMEVQQLRNRVELLESQQDSSIAFIDINEVCSGTSQLIFLLGGFDSISWLSALDCYSPSRDSTRSLRPMSSVRSYAAAAVLDKQIYIFGGGGDNDTWYDSVESYDPISNEWNSCPSLIERKGDLAGAALHGKLYAMGGGTGHECYSGVEMFDPALGRWIPTQSMMHKRFASAAVELNGALYVVGGYDGENYLKSAERFDPREEVSWKSFPSMNAGRGSHSLVVYNEKIYALGGHDGTKIVNSVELFDPRMGSWMISDSMKQTRGYSSAAVMDSSIYVIGGLQDGMKFLDTVERYKEGEGWRITHSKAVGERCAFSAVVL